MKKSDLQAQLDDLAERHSQLAAVCGRLAAHAEVLAIAVRSPQAVPLHNSPLRA